MGAPVLQEVVETVDLALVAHRRGGRGDAGAGAGPARDQAQRMQPGQRCARGVAADAVLGADIELGWKLAADGVLARLDLRQQRVGEGLVARRAAGGGAGHCGIVTGHDAVRARRAPALRGRRDGRWQ